MNVVGTETVGSACCWNELAWPFVLLALPVPDLALFPDSVRKLEILLETSCSRHCYTVRSASAGEAPAGVQRPLMQPCSYCRMSQ